MNIRQKNDSTFPSPAQFFRKTLVRVQKVILTSFFLVALLLPFYSHAEREVLFEGYFKINNNKQHIGYSISKYEFDSNAKKFFVTIFTKTGALGGNFIESIKATSDVSLVPLSYEYTTLVTDGNKNSSKKIDVTFRSKKTKETKPLKNKKSMSKKAKDLKTMIATVNQDGKISKIQTDLPEGAFMSYFLIYLMLKSKSGLQTGSRYEYKAIAEEKAKVVSGEAKVSTMEEYKNLKAYKIENTFDEQLFISYVTDHGELLGVNNPALGVETELVAKPNEAVGDFPFPTASLKTLFGEVPLGTKNILSKALKAEAFKASTEPPGSKQFGTPAGSGIQSKTTGSQEQETLVNPQEKNKNTQHIEKIEKPLPGTGKKEATEKK